MPLSVQKLQTLLETKGQVPVKFFTVDNYCMFIELINSISGTRFLMYIPSKYEFKMSQGKGVYRLKYIPIDKNSSIVEEYSNSSELETDYSNTMINLSPDKNDELENHLENNYKHMMSLKDISEDDLRYIKSIYRQLRRLRQCVLNIKYKVGIIYKNYLCVIRRDDSIDCFYIKHFTRKDSKKLLIITDLETFYDKGDKLIEDIIHVQDGVHRVMYRNQFLHSGIMGKMMENKSSIETISAKTNEKRVKYDAMLSKLNQLLEAMNNVEIKALSELQDLDVGSRTSSLSSDIDIAHRKAQLHTKLEEIGKVKEKIFKNMNDLREKRENTALSVDEIMFDNVVMFDSMVKNFAKLKQFTE